MTTRAGSLVLLIALLTVGGNLLMREGVVRAGGLSLTLPTFLTEMRNLAQQPVFVVGVLCYGLASVVWFGVISSESLNSSYPLLVSVTFILVTLGATVLFREPLSLQKALGVAVLLVGIVLVATAK